MEQVSRTVLVSSLIVLLFLIGGGLIWSFGQSKRPLSQIKLAPTLTPQPTPKWEVYRSQLGYQISYPADLTLREHGKVGEKVLDMVTFSAVVDRKSQPILAIKYYDQDLNALTPKTNLQKVERITIAGQNTVKMSGSSPDTNLPVETIYLAAKEASRSYAIVSTPVVGQKVFFEIIETMLKGFRLE